MPFFIQEEEEEETSDLIILVCVLGVLIETALEEHIFELSCKIDCSIEKVYKFLLLVM